MRFADKASCAALFTLAALVAGDGAANAGGKSGHAGGGGAKKSGLGASYAGRRSGSAHVPGKSGITSGKPAAKTTGGTGLGSSRIATSQHKASGAVETAPAARAKTTARPQRPVKTRAEERAVVARASAVEAEQAASTAETSAQVARRAADAAAELTVRREGSWGSARSAVTIARQRLEEASSLADELEVAAVAAESDLATVEAEGKRKRGSKAVRSFMSALSFGWIAPPSDLSTLKAELEALATGTAASARRAKAEATKAARALVAAELALISAETAAQVARTDRVNAEKRARQLEREAQVLRATAAAADQTAAELEDAADLAAERMVHKIARVDQHRLRVGKAGKSERTRFRRAARQTRLVSLIESKPAEVAQDAVAAAPEKGLYAIADGVTNSDYSGEFARSLVRRWTEAAPDGGEEFSGWLAGAQAEWTTEVEPLIAGKATAWYNRNKTWQGDAAFVGARLIQRGARRQLRLTGIGDTVAFLVRGGRIVKSFPLERAADFSDVVKALPSVGAPPFAPLSATWEVEPGDEVFMGTDALAHWILGETEAGRDPLPVLREIKNQKQMDRFVADARAGALDGHGTLGVDDTALLRFVVPDGPAD